MSRCKGLLFLGQNVFKGLPVFKTNVDAEKTISVFHNFSSRYLECTLVAKSSLKH